MLLTSLDILDCSGLRPPLVEGGFSLSEAALLPEGVSVALYNAVDDLACSDGGAGQTSIRRQ